MRTVVYNIKQEGRRIWLRSELWAITFGVGDARYEYTEYEKTVAVGIVSRNGWEYLPIFPRYPG